MSLPPKNPLVEYPMPSSIGIGTPNNWGGPFAWVMRASGRLGLVRIDDLPDPDKATVTVRRIQLGWHR